MLPETSGRYKKGPLRRKIDDINGVSHVAKKKQKGESSALPKSLPIPVFSNILPIVKSFWTGVEGEINPSEDLKMLRKSLGVVTKGNLALCPPPVADMQSNGVPDSFRAVFKSLSYSQPTPVQKQTWPCALCGANILAVAPTGSGKTYAYGLPLMVHVLENIKKLPISQKKIVEPIGLVLVPTRELGIQVNSAFKVLRRVSGVYTSVVYGGVDRIEQVTSLVTSADPVHIIVATPGRLLDIIAHNSSQVNMSKVSMIVLDECDKMLDLGFTDQITMISSQIRPDRQSLLYTATFPGRLREVAKIWLGGDSTVEFDDKNGKNVFIRCNVMEFNQASASVAKPAIEAEVAGKSLNVEDRAEVEGDNEVEQQGDDGTEDCNSSDEECSGDDVEPVTHSKPKQHSTLTVNQEIKQEVHVCASHKKPRLLMRFIEGVRAKEKAEHVRQPGQILIFCAKIKTITFLLQFLKKQEIECDKLCGQMSQEIREKVLSNFRAGKLNILIATDVAARGLHIKRLKYVVNYDFPSNLEQYCHRVGRTGRDAARPDNNSPIGTAYSLITRNMAALANDLIALLERCNQIVEPNLRGLARDYVSGAIITEAVEEDDE